MRCYLVFKGPDRGNDDVVRAVTSTTQTQTPGMMTATRPAVSSTSCRGLLVDRPKLERAPLHRLYLSTSLFTTFTYLSPEAIYTSVGAFPLVNQTPDLTCHPADASGQMPS